MKPFSAQRTLAIAGRHLGIAGAIGRDVSQRAFAGTRRRGRTLLREMDRLSRRRVPMSWQVAVWVVLALVLAHAFELRTALVQSHLFSALAQRLEWTVEPGRSESIVLPRAGPLDRQRGYTRLSEFAARLEERGYRMVQQARFSPALQFLARNGVTPPWREPSAAGLVIVGSDGDTLYDALADLREFRSYDEIPPVVVRTLLYIENRELGRDDRPYANPAVDWGRLALAATLYAGHRAGLPVRVEGGSTLAVQLEKFRHSEGGRTDSGLEKLRQIAAASLEVYRRGRDTRGARREIVLDYLNSMPLAATPGHGEVHGLSEGLRAWFALDPERVWDGLRDGAPAAERARAFQPVLALLCALRAPTDYLARDPRALAARMNRFARLLADAGAIDPELAAAVERTPLALRPSQTASRVRSFAERKAADAARTRLQELLGVDDRYALDQLHVEARTTIDPGLQAAVHRTFRLLADPDSLAARGLDGERLLSQGDPRAVVYTFTLLERTPAGDRLCAYADNLERPFDANGSMKLELGSTAKLRTLAHYLELMAGLHRGLSGLDAETHAARIAAARDPLTYWAAKALYEEPALDADSFLVRTLEREYPASPWETFFTGGGLHSFGNFDADDNGRVITVREASIKSTNLVYVRLMRDIVRYHTARLPYDAAAVLEQGDHPKRRELLEAFVTDESRRLLAAAWRRFRDDEGAAARRAIAAEYDSLHARYRDTDFTLLDYGWLMRRPPLDVWCAVELQRDSTLAWEDLYARSADARDQASAWLFNTRNRRAQDLRLRTRVEQDAFERMTPAWKRLGFAFDRLVPSYATAIGSSSDQPLALAGLMGTILDDGIRKPPTLVPEIRFAEGSPYQTIWSDSLTAGERVMSPAVARALRRVLGEVVERGTARRLRDVFTAADGTPLPIGGKTGSGDNRLKRIGRHGQVLDSRPLSRTAAFAFYLGERHFGVVTAAVLGRASGDYRFTSALPLEIVKQLAPAIQEHLHERDPAAAGDRLARDAYDPRATVGLAGVAP